MRTSKDYITAIKAKYEEEKNRQYPVSLNDLKRNSLKEFCEDLFNKEMDLNDRNTFASFFRFNPELSKKDQLKVIENFHLDGFRKVVYFLTKNVTNPKSKVVELVAILVDFTPRPFAKFRDSEDIPLVPKNDTTDKKTEPLPETHSEDEDPINDDHPKKIAEIVSEPTIDIVDQNKKTEENSGETESEKTEKQPVDIDLTKVSEKTDTKETQPGNSSFPDTNIQSLFGPNNPNHITYKADEEKEKEKKETVIPPHRTEKRILLATFLRTNKIFLISSSFSVLVSCLLLFDKPIFGSKNRMLWKEDHYEQVDGNEPDLSEETVPFDKTLQEKFRKVAYSDTLVFFDPYGKPLIWYSKLNGGYELFTHYGKHPITDKTLKPITQTIVSNLSNDPNR